MMQHHLAVQARFRPEVLERVLRVIRHRGFQVCAMHMAETALDPENIHLELTVASPRPIDLLFSQLTKLTDVARVEIRQHTSQQIRALAQ